jgi:hypothetical protein
MLQLTTITVDTCRTALEQSSSVASCKQHSLSRHLEPPSA